MLILVLIVHLYHIESKDKKINNILLKIKSNNLLLMFHYLEYD